MVTDSVTARVEYRYTDYEDKTFRLGDEDDVNTDFSYPFATGRPRREILI